MVNLIPVWDTPASTIGTYAESSAISIQLQAHEELRITGVAMQFVVVVGAAVSRAQSLIIGGVVTPFTINALEGTVIWATPLTTPSTVVIQFSASLTYSVLNGALPAGLSLDAATGLISGTLGNVSQTGSATFTVRATNANALRDRTFTVGMTAIAQPATFYSLGLRPLRHDAAVGRTFKDLGSFDLDACVAVTLDILVPDGVLPPLVVVPATDPPAGYLTGMPRGLVLNDRTIEGAISPEACPGSYLFEIHIQDPIAPSFMTFRIGVTDVIASTFNVIPEIIWDTPSGDLGSYSEREPSYLHVRAHAIGITNAISYGLSHMSAPLPPGMAIDPVTGRLIGDFPHVTTDTVYTFIVRAKVDQIFSDRSFSVTVQNRFNTNNTYHMLLRLRSNERNNLLTAYHTLVDDSLIYRPDDANFGRPDTADMYLIMGLDGTRDLGPVLGGANEPVGRVGGTYHAPFKLVLGQHRFGYARDASGSVIYEVVLRELYDPQARAGGFLPTALVSELPVLYPQDRSLAVFPNSINNIRRDLVNGIGFAVSDTTQRHTIGLSGPELLPLWMRSPQVAGDPATVPGFIPTVVIAYLKPGSIKAVTRSLALNADAVPEMGAVYYFDRYTIGTVVLDSTTTFDGDLVVFDGHTTLFDPALLEEVNNIKYLDQVGAS